MSFILVQNKRSYKVSIAGSRKSDFLRNNVLADGRQQGEVVLSINIPSITNYVDYINATANMQKANMEGNYIFPFRVDIFDEFQVGYALEDDTYTKHYEDLIRANPDRRRMSQLSKDELRFLADHYVLPPSYLPSKYYPQRQLTIEEIALTRSDGEEMIDEYTRNWVEALIRSGEVNVAADNADNEVGVRTSKYTYWIGATLYPSSNGGKQIHRAKLKRVLLPSNPGEVARTDGKEYHWLDGKRQKKVSWVEGNLNGLTIDYDSEGRVEAMTEYTNNLENGKSYIFSDEEYLESEMKNGKLNGLSIRRDLAGNIISETYYKNNVEVKQL